MPEADEILLKEAGYSVQWEMHRGGLFRAVVSRDGEHVRLDWSFDSAFRFFPAQSDEDFGYCLHPADLATNKVLALVGRSEIRDFLDTLQLDEGYLSLGLSSGQLVAKTRDSRPCKSLIWRIAIPAIGRAT